MQPKIFGNIFIPPKKYFFNSLDLIPFLCYAFFYNVVHCCYIAHISQGGRYLKTMSYFKQNSAHPLSAKNSFSKEAGLAVHNSPRESTSVIQIS